MRFVAAISRPIYREWLKMAIASQAIKLPDDIDQDSLFNAVYSRPVMPWIDPIKEANAWKERIKGDLATEGQAIRASGNNPSEVKRQRIVEVKENARESLKFDTDLTNTGKIEQKGSTQKLEEPIKEDK